MPNPRWATDLTERMEAEQLPDSLWAPVKIVACMEVLCGGLARVLATINSAYSAILLSLDCFYSHGAYGCQYYHQSTCTQFHYNGSHASNHYA